MYLLNVMALCPKFIDFFFVCLFEAKKSQDTFTHTLKYMFSSTFLRSHMYDHKHRDYFHLNRCWGELKGERAWGLGMLKCSLSSREICSLLCFCRCNLTEYPRIATSMVSALHNLKVIHNISSEHFFNMPPTPLYCPLLLPLDIQPKYDGFLSQMDLFA